MPNTDINIEVLEDLKVIISTENTMYNLNCLNIEDYPQINLEETKNPIIIESDVLKKIISQTIFAISTQESRPLLTGLNFKITGNVLECIATDSYRLAKKTIILDKEYDSCNIVIPGKNINEFDKLLNKAAVVGTPGVGFGPSGEGYFRLTAFGSYENTVAAIERIKKM